MTTKAAERAEAEPVAATSTKRSDKPGFRADIEGLRAVAILMVAVYHVWVGRVSGGVDVFLMVSGFFVGASVVRSYAERRPQSLGAYYRRVFGRLLPPALLVLAAILVSTWLLLPRTRMTETAQQGLASLLYYENWYLATTGQAYGAADISQSMTQHFWSLSVQGQIFLALPLLLAVLSLVLGRRATRRVYLCVVTVLAVGSFAYATYLVQVDQAFAYYNTGARLWEYLAGTLLAFAVAVPAVGRMPSWLSALLGACGLVLVLLTGVLVDGANTFPGPTTLVPVLGAAAIVLAGAGTAGRQERARANVTSMLSARPLVVAGSHAYSFYLWHWPVLVLALALRDGQPVGWIAGTVILLTSAVLAWGTDTLLAVRRRQAAHPAQSALPPQGGQDDQPHPRRLRRPGLRVVAATACALLVVGGSTTWLLTIAHERRSALGADTLDLAQYPGALARVDSAVWPVPDGVEPYPAAVLAQADWPGKERSGCAADAAETTLYRCVFGEEGAALQIVLVGGSHSVNFLNPVDEVARHRGIEVVTYFKQGCPVRFVPGDRSSCELWSRAVVQEILSGSVDAVVLTGTRPTVDGPGDSVPDSYLSAWEELLLHGVPVIAIRDNPWLPFDGAECVESRGAGACTVDRADVLDEVNPLDELAEQIDLLYAVDFSDIFCDDEVCQTVIGNVQAYIDDNHLTSTFSRTLASVLDERMGSVTGWW